MTPAFEFGLQSCSASVFPLGLAIGVTQVRTGSDTHSLKRFTIYHLKSMFLSCFSSWPELNDNVASLQDFRTGLLRLGQPSVFVLYTYSTKPMINRVTTMGNWTMQGEEKQL